LWVIEVAWRGGLSLTNPIIAAGYDSGGYDRDSGVDDDGGAGLCVVSLAGSVLQLMVKVWMVG